MLPLVFRSITIRVRNSGSKVVGQLAEKLPAEAASNAGMAPPLPMRRDATLGLDHEFAEVRRHGVQADIRAGCQLGLGR